MTTWMNEHEVEDAARRWRTHPILGPATRTLSNLVAVTNRNSDGWPYWQKPARAAAKLMDLIEGDRSWDARHGDRDDVTEADLRAAYRPIKSFLTRHNLVCTIVEPGAKPESQLTKGGTECSLLVKPPITEDQWRTLHRICGVEEPGRFKEWVNEGPEHGGFSFEPRGDVFDDAIAYARQQGLSFTSEITTRTEFAPPA